MMPIAQALSCWKDPALVVYVGAGDGLVLDAVPESAYRRLVLVEGDPDTVAELQARAQGRPGVEVRQAVVASAAGTLVWHRFNLRMLNGPQEALGLMAFYPRLRRLGQVELAATSLGALLADLTDGTALDSDGARVLVLDVPGQESALLDSLPQAMLQRFDGIVLRGCSVAVPGVVAVAALAVQRLEQRLYRRVASFDDAEPLWPVHALAFDEEKARQQAAEQRLGALQAEVETLRREAHEGRARADELERSMAAASASAAGELAKERDKARQALVRANDLEQAHAAALATLAQRDDALALAHRALATRDEALATAQARLADHEQALADMRSRVGALTAERDAAAASADKLRRQVALAHEGAGALQAHIDQLRTESEVQLVAHTEQARALEQLQAERKQLVSECDQATARAAEAAEQLKRDLADARRAHDRQAVELQERIAQLEAELAASVAKAEAQSAAHAEQARALQVQAARVEELAAQVQALEGQRTELAAAHAAQARALEQLQVEQTRLVSERDHAALQAADVAEQLKQDLADARQAHDRQAAELLQRTAQLEAELAAGLAEAEAQSAARAEQARAWQVQQDEAQAAGQAQAARVDELAAQVRALEGQRTELAAAHAAQGHMLEQLQAERTRLVSERDQATRQVAEVAERLQQELADARQTASLSVKLQMLREADLRDLQQRYQAAQAQQQSQHELLSKLAQRLSLANQYFQQLSHEQQADELVDDRGAR